MRKRLHEVFSRYTWPEIEPVYVRLYPDEIGKSKRARQAWEFIQSLEPAGFDMRIYIEYQEEPEESYHDVFGRDGSLGHDGQEETYGLFLVDWDKWLGMEIAATTLEHYSELDILCHCFWEMVWCGYAVEEVQKFRKELDQISTEETKNIEELRPL
jgi:hypothetical protein